MSNVGMMEGAFFVGRNELLSWANSFLQLSLTKVEQCANGAVYCQVIDACHPGNVAMKKVNWSAKDAHQCIPNYKILQQAFDKCQITRHVPVEQMVRGKYQDNLEMLQWIKAYFDRTYGGADYDPTARRFGDPMPEWARASGGDLPTGAGAHAGHAAHAAPHHRGPAGGAAPGTGSRRPPSAGTQQDPTKRRVQPGDWRRAEEGLKDEVEKFKEEVVDLKITVDGLETERDFYFQKLRDMEILCQAYEANPDPNMTVPKFVENVQRILYAKDEDDEEPAQN